MTRSDTLQPRLRRLQSQALLVGLGGAGLSGLGALSNAPQFWRAYLIGFMLWLGVVLGCLAVLMLHHLMGGLWGMVTRRVLEAATRLLPLLLILCVPLLLFGLPVLYTWARPEGLESHAGSAFRQVYLSVPFFLGRVALSFAVWLLLTGCLNAWSRRQEQAQDPVVIGTWGRRLGLLSGGGLVLYGLTVTVAAIDWLMSLEPLWFSSIYGFLVVSGQLLSAMAFAIVAVAWLARDEPYAAVASPGVLHDLGNLLLAFVMLWAYIAFSQFLVIWSGNLPEEIPWYLRRGQGGWGVVAWLLFVLHFALPFVLLLSRRTKRQVPRLAAVAALVLGMRLVEIDWLVMPAFFPGRLYVHWLDIVVPVAMGGLWLAVLIWQLQRRSLLPQHEPRLQEVMPHG